MTKLYSIEKSPFYRLRNRRKLAKHLGLPEAYFTKQREYNYDEFSKPKANGDGVRDFCVPSDDLKEIQKKLYKLLKRVETPEWLMSGKSGCSYVTNASIHTEENYIRTMDISKFYDSASYGKIYKMFKEKFLVENDIAWILTNLVTYKGGLPTGSPASQLIVYWAYSDMFQQIYEVAVANECRFSLYVDDMTFSSKNHISMKFRNNIARILSQEKLCAKLSKDHYFQTNDFKVVTGVGIRNGKQIIQNKKRKKILDLYKECREQNDIYKIEKLRGMLCSLRQVEPNIFPDINKFVMGYRKELVEIARSRNIN